MEVHVTDDQIGRYFRPDSTGTAISCARRACANYQSLERADARSARHTAAAMDV